MPIAQPRICARCSLPEPPGAGFCPRCGLPIGIAFKPIRPPRPWGVGLLIWLFCLFAGVFVFLDVTYHVRSRLIEYISPSPRVDPNYFQPVYPDRAQPQNDRSIPHRDDRVPGY